MTLLFSKIVLSAGMVMAVTTVTERYGPRVGGLGASLPQLAVLSLIFFGLEQGLEFAAQAAFWNISGTCSTIPFVFGYVAGAALAPDRRVLSIAAGTLAGNALFVFATAILGTITLPPQTVVPLAAVLCGGTPWFARHLPDTAPLQRVGASVAILAARAGLASVAVVVITSVAYILGPRWSGLVTGYPVNALPVIAVLHFQYGFDVIRAMAKVWPIGVFGICVFNLVAWLTVAWLGLGASILLGYIADLAYLLLAEQVRRIGTWQRL